MVSIYTKSFSGRLGLLTDFQYTVLPDSDIQYIYPLEKILIQIQQLYTHHKEEY